MTDIQQEIREALKAHKWICDYAEFRHGQRAEAGRYGQSVRAALTRAGEALERLRARVEELEKAMRGVEHMVEIAHHPSDWAEYDDKLKAVIAAFHDALAASEGGEG